MIEHRERKALLALDAKLAETREHQSCLEREIVTLEDKLMLAQRRLAEADELELRRVEQARKTSELNIEQVKAKSRLQSWINEVSIDWAATAEKLAAARRH